MKKTTIKGTAKVVAIVMMMAIMLVGCNPAVKDTMNQVYTNDTSDDHAPTTSVEATKEETEEETTVIAPVEEEETKEETKTETEEPVITPSPEPTQKPEHAHDYSCETKNATCEANGVCTYTCSCGDSYTESIKATGHNYKSSVAKEATCSESGSILYTCSNCGNIYTEVIPAHGHKMVTTEVAEIGHVEQVYVGDDFQPVYETRYVYECKICGSVFNTSKEMQIHAGIGVGIPWDFNNPCLGADNVFYQAEVQVGEVAVPMYATQWVVDTPASTIRKCEICGYKE